MATVKAETEAATGTANKAFTGMAGIGKIALLGVGAAAIGVGAISLHMAGDFESSTNRLVTSAGEIRGNLDMVRSGMLKMAGDVGIGAEQLSAGMYIVESAGLHGANGLTVLRAAAEGAKTENADLATVANAVTSAMADYHLGADQAAMVTTKLVSAVSVGKTTFQDLTGSMHSVLPVASAAHVSMSDILGDLASMTLHGESADQATQNLAHTIQHLQTTTAPQNKELALLGINARQLSDDLGTKGLSGTLQEISAAIQRDMGANGHVILQMQTALRGLPPEVQKLGAAVVDGSMSLGDFTKAAKGLNVEAAGQAHQFATLMTSTHGIGSAQKTGAELMQSYAQALKAATGDSTTLNTALMLTGENADYTNSAVKTVAGATTEAGNHVAGWSSIQATFNQHLARSQASAGAMAITLGTALIPVAIKVMDVTSGIVEWLGKHQAVSVALAGAIGGILLVTIAAYTVAMVAAAVATIAATWPILLIIAAAALLGIGIALLISHWGQLTSFLGGVVHGALTAIGGAFSALGGAVHGFINGAGSAIGGFFSGLGSMVHGALDAVWAAVTGFVGGVVGAIGGFFSHLGSLASSAWAEFSRHPIYWIAYILAFVPIKLAMLQQLALMWLMHMVQDALKWAGQMKDHALKAGSDFLAAAINEIQKLPGQIWTWLTDIIAKAVDWAGQMKDRAMRAGQDFLSAVGNEIQQLPGQVWNWLWEMIIRLGTWEDQMGQKALSAAQTFGRNLLDELGKLPGQMWDVGVNIVNGIIDGIKSMAASGIGSIGDFVHGLVQGAKDASKSSSPSRLFAEEVGLPIAQGVMVGIQSGSAGVQGALNSMIAPPSLSAVTAGGASSSVTPATSVGSGLGLDDTNELLVQLYHLLDERLPRGSKAAFSTKAYSPGT